MSEANGHESVRVDLHGSLEGRHIMVRQDGLTMGVVEDMSSGNVKQILDAVAEVVVGGDVPGGVDRAGLRKLKPAEFGDVIMGLKGVLEVPKGT